MTTTVTLPCHEHEVRFWNGFAQYLFPGGYCEELNKWIVAQREGRRRELGY